jgi:uncharacterized membrane protein
MAPNAWHAACEGAAPEVNTMWMQAQNLVLTNQIEWHTPVGILLMVGLLVITAAGVLVESDAVPMLLGRLVRRSRAAHAVARVAPSAQRG